MATHSGTARRAPTTSAPLADLHLHLYGTIRHSRFLQYIRDRQVDWSGYAASFQAAYGAAPPIADVLARHRAGDARAVQEFQRLFVFGDDDAGNFSRFQAKFDMLNAASVYDELKATNKLPPVLRDELRFFAQSALQHHPDETIGYAEQRFGVDLNNRPSVSPAAAGEVLELMLELFADEERQGSQRRLAVSLSRGNPWLHWPVVQDIALGPYGQFLTGIDFCNVEEGHPPKEKAAFFSAVHAFNKVHPDRALAILYHVGESFRDKSLESAVRWVQEAAGLGAHRLGHAIALGVDPRLYGEHTRTENAAERRDQLAYDLRHAEGLERHGAHVDVAAIERELATLRPVPSPQVPAVGEGWGEGSPRPVITHHYDRARLEELRRRQEYAIERVRATGAVVEVCPTSNRRIGGIADPLLHPVHRFLAHDLPFVVGSDDPGIFDVTLQDEIDWVVRAAGLSTTTARLLAERSWRCRSEVLTGREKV